MNGLIYILQDGKDLNTNIYKIGKTMQPIANLCELFRRKRSVYAQRTKGVPFILLRKLSLWERRTTCRQGLYKK